MAMQRSVMSRRVCPNTDAGRNTPPPPASPSSAAPRVAAEFEEREASEKAQKRQHNTRRQNGACAGQWPWRKEARPKTVHPDLTTLLITLSTASFSRTPGSPSMYWDSIGVYVCASKTIAAIIWLTALRRRYHKNPDANSALLGACKTRCARNEVCVSVLRNKTASSAIDLIACDYCWSRQCTP